MSLRALAYRSHWRRFGLVYALGVGLLVLLVSGRWAAGEVAERDAGITWAWAVSPRTSQSYLVRAIVDDGQLRQFTLEAGDTYTFDSCAFPAGDAIGSCTDTAGNPWRIEAD